MTKPTTQSMIQKVMTQNPMTQNPMTQNSMTQNSINQNTMTHNARFSHARFLTMLGTVLAFCTVLGLGAASALAQTHTYPVPKPVTGLDKINHIIVIYLENRSFDNLYGLFPGADGLANAGDKALQRDRDSNVYDKLPPVLNTSLKPAAADARFPSELANTPFQTDAFVNMEGKTGDLVHRFYQEQKQIDGGKMDKYIAWSDAGSLVMSYYDGAKMPLWDYAKHYVLMDHFFHAAFGGSFLNHVFMVCACAPLYQDAPDKIVAKLDDKGTLVKDGIVTPDGYAVNTIQPRLGPHSVAITDASLLLPPQVMPTIGDRLSGKGISWAWYAGGWDDAVAGKPDALFQFHHQPFAMFANTALGTDGGKTHLLDERNFVADLESGNLPAVAFFKPLGAENEHPGYANVMDGERHTVELLQRIEKSPVWKDSVVIITYDENGGLWDHVAPPALDVWGPGTRVPTLIISPFAKRGFVDHTVYDTTAILKLIETRFGLAPLAARDAASGDLTSALDLSVTN